MLELDRLIQLLAKLPGLGPRSARRAALYLIKRRESVMEPLALALKEAAAHIHPCSVCGNLDTSDPCSLCRDSRRDQGTICVVEDVADLWAIERSASFHGVYHVLGGTLSALDGIGPEDLAIPHLLQRASDPQVKEVIVALNASHDRAIAQHGLSDQRKAELLVAVQKRRVCENARKKRKRQRDAAVEQQL